MQKEAVARELKRARRVRLAKFAAMAAAAVVALHVSVTRYLYCAPSDAALQARIEGLPAAVVPLLSSVRQPLQAEGVTIAQSDEIDGGTIRYVAAVTLRLRKPLYTAAVSNGTASYHRMQDALQGAREQELRYHLFSLNERPDLPVLPQLLQRTHQAGEAIVVRVPFTARRFGWTWRIETPQVALATPNRVLTGDSLDRYENAPYLIFGDAATLGDIRQRVKLAQAYVVTVAKEVQRRSNGAAVAEPAPAVNPTLADQPAVADEDAVADRVAHVEARPAFDPNAPAVVLGDAPRTR
jgi:hypothetical protein